MKTSAVLLMLPTMLMLAACGDDFVPREKTAQFDPVTGEAESPYPCPDWSHSALINYDNSVHSNYGCAVNTNVTQQVANPEDLAHGSGSTTSYTPDTEMTTHVIEQYRAGEIPQPLESQQESAAEGE